MIIGLDHIAVAVPDLQAAIKRYSEDFGLPLKGTEDVPDAKTSTAFLPVAKTQVELVHPLNGEGPIQKFLDNKGGGLHHLCFRSDDLEADMKRLAAKGYEFISDKPKPGAHGTSVAWIHPKSTNGVLIEIAQYGDDHPD